jgi:hypothetical protein
MVKIFRPVSLTVDSGHFEAVGYELVTLRNPWVLASVVGIFQVFPVLILGRYLVAEYYFHIPGSCFSQVTQACLPYLENPGWTQYSETAAPITLGLMVLSFIVLGAWRVRNHGFNALKNYDVSFSRSLGGDLRVSFTDTAGNRRESVLVRKLVPHTHHPLMKQVGSGRFATMRPVSGTESSLDIVIARPQLALYLGFENANSMDKVYEELKAPDIPGLDPATLGRPLGLEPHHYRHLVVSVIGYTAIAGIAFLWAFGYDPGVTSPAILEIIIGVLAFVSTALLAIVFLQRRRDERPTLPST